MLLQQEVKTTIFLYSMQFVAIKTMMSLAGGLMVLQKNFVQELIQWYRSYSLFIFKCLLGGRWFKQLFGDVDVVDPDVMLDAAKESVKRHLGIAQEPVRYSADLLKVGCLFFHPSLFQ